MILPKNFLKKRLIDKHMDLISIVVPIYNVGKYLKRCIESVINQSYKNLQIILVDDGSTDGSGEICDTYAQNDSRIEVIHKKNGGLSEARNVGIDVAVGEYIAFIDSDDWIRSDYVEALKRAIDIGKTKISACAYLKTFQKTITENKDNICRISNCMEIWNINEAYQHLFLNRRIDNSACAKLYARDLFKNIRYPVGKLYEDQFVTYKLFHISQGVTFINSQMYFYFDRPGSIQNEQFTDKKMDELEAATGCVEFIHENYPYLKEEVHCRYISSCFHILFAIKDTKKFQKEILFLETAIKQYRKDMVFGKNINRKVRVGCLCSYLGFGAVKLIYELTGVKGKINI